MDAVISTAAVPGRPAPLLVIEDAVRRMRPGSVIVDVAAETGGNCELTEPGKTVVRHGDGLRPARPAVDHARSRRASTRNLLALLELMVDDGRLAADFEDEVIAGACITAMATSSTRRSPGCGPGCGRRRARRRAATRVVGIWTC